MADEAWTDIDMILRTFEVPDIDHPGGAQYDYVLLRLTEGSNSALIALHAYLYPDASTAPAAEQSWAVAG